MGYFSHTFWICLSTSFTFYSIMTKVDEVYYWNDRLAKKLDKFANEMGPWGEKIFMKTPGPFLFLKMSYKLPIQVKRKILI